VSKNISLAFIQAHCSEPVGIQVVDLVTGASRSVPTESLRANFPMAIDPDAHRVLVAFRSPPTMLMMCSSMLNAIAFM